MKRTSERCGSRSKITLDAASGGEADAASPSAAPAGGKSKYRAPKSKGERNAYAFLDQTKKRFLQNPTLQDDLEECLAEEWDKFCDECEGRLGEDRNLSKAFQMLRGVFDTLGW